jgi:hypothetical protein
MLNAKRMKTDIYQGMTVFLEDTRVTVLMPNPDVSWSFGDFAEWLKQRYTGAFQVDIRFDCAQN